MPAVLFLAYLLYGVLRPWLSRDWRREIEEEIGEESAVEVGEEKAATEVPEFLGANRKPPRDEA
jgi:hypothetical protein